MEQLKRPWNEIIDDYEDNKRKKMNMTIVETNCLTKECITSFEDLSNELIYEIFELVDFHHAFEAFYDLNQRFQNLFVYSNLPININISSISKSRFQRYLTHIIIPHTDRIQFLRLSNPFAADMSLLLYPIMANLTHLKALTLNDIESEHIEGVVNHLSSLPVLSSLVISSIDNIKNQNDIYLKIYRLPTLKYCQIFIETLRRLVPLSIARNEFSSIEHLVIKNKVSIHQLHSLLSYVPQLRRLLIGHLDGQRGNQTSKSSISLNYLTHVSINLYSVSFADFEPLITAFSRQLQVLRIVVRFPVPNVEFLNADRWERIISTDLPNLRVFDFQHQYRGWNIDTDRPPYETQVTKFNSRFWMKHQWFFEHLYTQTAGGFAAVFYSVDPYRRKFYALYERSTTDNWIFPFDINEDPVHHVYIHSTNATKQLVGDFPNATELTLCKSFDVPRHSLVLSLNRIIPLRQLSKLFLDCHRFHFEQVIELLHCTPNIHTLKLDSILFYGADSVSIQQNDIFGIVSNTNTVTNVTISNESSLDKIELLVALFPRLEYLTINLYTETLEPIVRFLLSKPNDNTRYLSSICVSKQRSDLTGKLRNLIESEKLLYDYTIKVINRKLYLWW